MSAGNNHINYTAADFARYHAGKMSVKEMHALEKAALDDPFLQDALDGYLLTETAVADIAFLKDRLPKKEEEAKVIAMTPNYFATIMKIAAVFILIAGLSWLFVFKDKNDEPIRNIAKVEPTKTVNTENDKLPTAKAAEAEKSAATPKTTETNNDAVARQTPAEPTREPVLKPARQAESAPVAVADEQAKTIPSEDKAMVQSQIAQEQSKDYKARKYDNESSQNNNVLNGVVRDQSGSPVSNAIVRNNATNAVVSSDVNGNFNIASNNANTNVTVEAPGFSTQNVTLNRDTRNNNVVLNEANASLSEVVVSGYGNTRKKQVAAATAKISKEQLSKAKMDSTGSSAAKSAMPAIRNAIPLKGFTAYHQYLAKQTIAARKKIDPFISGTVILSFTITDAGKPTNITVTQSLSPLHDAAAVKILTDGPGWKVIDNMKPAQLEIIF